jgi:type I restriction enzyme, S subunit
MIPKGWKRGLMGEVIKLISGQHIEAQFYNEDKIGIPYLTGPSDFQDGKINITKYTEQPKVLCESGDILITVKGSGTGKSIIANQKCCIGRQLMAVRATKLDRTFAFYIIQSREAKYGDTASGLIPGIAREHILETSLLIPPLLEQCRIAEILGVWDESIDLLERLIGRVRSRKQGLMQQLLTGKKRFKEFEGSEWTEYQLSQIANITMGTSPKSESYNSNKEGLPLLQGNADIKNRVSSPRIWTSEVTKECYINDILISVRAPVGTIAISLHHACIGRGIASIKAKSKVLPNYLYQLLLFSEPKWASLSQGSTFDSVNSADIKSRIFSIPLMIPEQKKIAAVLSAADEEISTLEQQLAAYKQQKLGLMQQLLTGKIRVGMIQGSVGAGLC